MKIAKAEVPSWSTHNKEWQKRPHAWRDSSSSATSWRASRFVSSVCQPREETSRASRGASARSKEVQAQMEEKLASGLRDLEALREEASEHPRHCQNPAAMCYFVPARPLRPIV